MTDEEAEDAWSPTSVNITCGNGDGVHVTLLCNGKRIIVSFPPTASLDGTIEGSILKRFEDALLEDALQAKDHEEQDNAFYGVQNLVLDTGESPFARLAPAPAKVSPLPDLHSFLYPETFSFRFVIVDGKAELVLDEDTWNFDEPPPFDLDIENDIGLPTYSSRDIRVLEISRGDAEVAKVLIDGKEMFSRCPDPSQWAEIEREFKCLQTVARSRFVSTIRVPKLTGLVKRAGTGKLIGILEEYIPTDAKEPCTLQEFDISTIPELRRKKWSAQIRETADQLHEIGVVWGAGKPHNVLINGDMDDALLMDFGRGSTDDWADEILETKEGDGQAVEKIFKFLEV